MDQFLNKKYKFEEADEYFNDYLIGIGKFNRSLHNALSFNRISFLGLNFINRKLAKSIPSMTEIVKLNENEYGLNTIVPFKTNQQRFVIGQETENITIDGRKIKNIFTLDGNKLIEKQMEPNREVTLIREFNAKQMLGTSIVGKIVSKHVSNVVE